LNRTEPLTGSHIQPGATQATERDETVEPFYWDEYRDTTVGRYLFRREQAFIDRFLGDAPPPRELLDIGCGSGRLTLPMHRAGHTVTGLDFSPAALASFRRQSEDVPLVRGDATRLPFADGSFDGVIAIQSFDYLEHARFLAECHRVLRRDGLLIFDALNRRSYKWLLKNRVGRGLTLPSANLSYREVIRATVGHGFAIRAIRGYNWVPFTRHSDSRLVDAAALVESALQLDRFYSISPKILIAARKRSTGGHRPRRSAD
jgi:ubiquinone/menaquinone biosynthesis C-methylase UbiE